MIVAGCGRLGQRRWRCRTWLRMAVGRCRRRGNLGREGEGTGSHRWRWRRGGALTADLDGGGGRESGQSSLASEATSASMRAVEGGTRWRKMNGFGSFSRGEGIDYIQGRGLLTDYY